jgi:1-acyl-sn-glycerol-3-phosphate acyltransferase
MGQWISFLLLKLCGWKYVGDEPVDKRYVVISAPHTSGWDFVWGKLTFGLKKVNPVVFIKKESFFFPVGIILRWLGARPVNRGRGAVGLVDQILQYFEKNDEFAVCITPEGTREKVSKWKRGFYFIAQKANVPIYLGYIDYKRKELTMGERFMPTDNIEEDMTYICNYYKKHDPGAKYHEKFTFDFS